MYFEALESWKEKSLRLRSPTKKINKWTNNISVNDGDEILGEHLFWIDPTYKLLKMTAFVVNPVCYGLFIILYFMTSSQWN